MMSSGNTAISQSENIDNNELPVNSAIALDISEPDVGIPTLDNDQPSSITDVLVSFPVYDPDGIANTTVFYSYDSINNTVYNVSANFVGGVSIVNANNFPLQNSEYLNSFGEVVDFETNFRSGEYLIEDIILSADFTIESNDAGPGINLIVYYKVEFKNITTGLWELSEENGSPCCDDVSLTDPTFSFSNVAGIRVYAVSYHVNTVDVNIPQFDTLQIDQDQEQATIPASVLPSYVTYNAKTYDNTENVTITPDYKFLMDYTPIIGINNLPAVIGLNQELLVNVTITDNDNITTVDTASIMTYYRYTDSEVWYALNMDLFNQTSNFTSIYTKVIPFNILQTKVNTLEIMVNATDFVNGVSGYTGTVYDTITVDNEAPEVMDITFDSRSPIVNTTRVGVDVFIEATFSDSSGIQSAFIHYGTDEAGFQTMPMNNMSNLVLNVSPIEFNVLIPSIANTSDIIYYFEVTDFLNNTIITMNNTFYTDGEAPFISNMIMDPMYISNSTAVSILYNSTDASDILSTEVFYSSDNASSWSKVASNSVAYPPIYIDGFDLDDFYDMPLFINDSKIDYLRFRVNQSNNFDFQRVLLNIQFSHESGTDLRIWLITPSGKEYIVYDRTPGSGSMGVTIDLIALGLDKSVFKDIFLTLKIQDYSDDFTGILTSVTVDLVDYALPYGYDFRAIIPKTNNDSMVIFYIQSIDKLYNIVNSTMYSYYSDGFAPNITISPPPSSMDLSGSTTLRVEAEIKDKGGVQFAEVYYRYTDDDYYRVVSMIKDGSNNITYYGDIPLISQSGNLSYFIRVIDFVNFISESEIQTILFSNALAPVISILNLNEEPINLMQASSLTVKASITDNGEVLNVTISYTPIGKEDIVTEDMLYDEDKKVYYFDIPLTKKEGNLTLSITASDDSGLVSDTGIITVDYFNGNPRLTGLQTGLAITAGAVLVGGLVAGAVIILKKRKGKTPSDY